MSHDDNQIASKMIFAGESLKKYPVGVISVKNRREFISLGCKTLASLLVWPGLLPKHETELTASEPGQKIYSQLEQEVEEETRPERDPSQSEEEMEQPGTIPPQEASYYQKEENNIVSCQLCFRSCRIGPGERGYCGVRVNQEGLLKTLVFGNMAAVTFGPVEKKPLHQYLPGAQANNYGTAGCNLSCKFCHNYRLSQHKLEELDNYESLSPENALERARSRQVDLLSFTYNEPTVFYEFMLETARLARKEGLGVNVNTNAVLQEEPLRELMEAADSATVDLKGFSREFYREVCDGKLDPVLRNLKIIKEMDVWLEIVNLVIPELNDDLEEIQEMCRWIMNELGPNVPVHFNRFMPSYKLTDLPSTPVKTLEEARQVAVEEGLNYVYVGNVPGHNFNRTYCPECGITVIDRHHFTIRNTNIEEGRCGECGYQLAGVWEI